MTPVSNTHSFEESIMRKQVIALLIGSLLATSSWAGPKNKGPKEESVGIGSGAAIGALAGGPVGLILGAAFGGWLGDRFHVERSERRAADERATTASEHSASLQRALAASERAITAKDAELVGERVAHRRALEEALALEVYFRTEQSALDAAGEERLAKLVGLVAPIDGAVIRLEGHADARGTEDYNATLSAERATAVREALVKAGMPADRVVVTATGEGASTAAEQDADGMALDRRVEMRIVGWDDASRVAGR
jgi:outer membrane protein OmpA-like peptidoglycan-associated protein